MVARPKALGHFESRTPGLPLLGERVGVRGNGLAKSSEPGRKMQIRVRCRSSEAPARSGPGPGLVFNT
jgi:hypothetical protein